MAHRSIKKAGLSLATFAQAATDTDKILEKPSESPPSRIITRVCTTTGHAIGEPAFCTDGIGGSPSRSVREEEGVTCNERLTKTRSVRSTLFIGHAFTLVRKNRYIAISFTFTLCNKNVFFFKFACLRSPRLQSGWCAPWLVCPRASRPHDGGPERVARAPCPSLASHYHPATTCDACYRTDLHHCQPAEPDH